MVQIPGYVAPNVSVDCVLFQVIENDLSVLLIKRAREPFKGMWALPGGYNPAGETTQQAMARVLKTKAGVSVSQVGLIDQLYTFDTVARDPRGHAISVAYMGLGLNVTPKAAKNTHNPQFFPINDLPELAFDHLRIVKYAHVRLTRKLAETNAAVGLLPKLFTLSQLQKVYEAAYGHLLDKRNFRKKFLSLNLIQPTKEYFMDGAHRPARLYKFNNQKLEYLSKDLEKTTP